MVSKINAVGNSQALTNENIVDFLTRSSAAMKEAGNSFEQLVGLGTAAVEVVRDSSSVGNALKTVSMRLRGYDEETHQLSDDLKSLSGDIADLTKSAQHPMGVSLFTDETRTEYKSTYQILKDITEVYDELSDRDQAALLEKIAGKRNAQVVAAILNNFDAVDKSIETMQNSAGNAEKEMGVIMDSIEYKTNRLKETAVGIAQDIFQRDSTKRMVDNLTSFLEIINSLTKAVGGLGTALTAVMTYKGFKSGFGGTGLLNYLNNTKTGFKNFFTQRQLSDDALTLGITHDDVKLLTDYDKLLKATTQDTTAMATTMSRMSPAAQTFATNMQAGAASVESLTVATQAAQVGMKLLHATLSMGATLLISYGVTQFIKKMDELIVTEKEAKQQHDELIESINSNINKRNAEQKEIQALIKEYQSYGELTSYTAEQKEQLKNIQDQLIDTYGLEAEGIDLVNGKYEEQIKLLDKDARKKAKENNANLWAAYEETKSDYDNNSGYSFKQIFNANSIGTKGKGLFAKDVYEESALKKAFSDVFEETTKITGLHYNNMEKTSSIQTQEITFALRTVDEDGKPLDANAMLEQVLAIQDRIDEIRRDSSQQSLTQSAEFIALQEQVAAWTKHYRDEVDANNDTLNALAKNIALTTAVNIDGVDYYSDTVTSDIYNEFSKKLIEAYSKTNPEVAEAIAKYLDDTYGKAFGKTSLSRMEVEAKKAEEYRQAMLGSTYDYEDYKEEINGITKSVQTLSSAYEKLKKGEATDSDLLSLFDEFPELSAYANDTDKLAKEVQKLARSEVEPLVSSLLTLRETVKDPEQLEQLDGLVLTLTKLGNLSTGIDKTAEALEKVTASDYIKYEEDRVQDIIDKLEKEKDAQNDILDSLKAQKEELESIISDYEKTADVVGKFIDRTEIEPLNDRKSEIEEYYNTEIEKLKEENAERDRNIDLQEKQDALANARKTKVRVYSETQGWHYENDVQAIQKAEKELSDLENEITIDNLEKQRDAEVKDIESQIKAWEKYKDQWKEQVDAITEADEELTASKILGSDWREKIADKDIGVMNDFSAGYVAYNNRLNNQVNVEIASVERAISERDREIENWKDYKTQIGDLNKDITESNQKYLEGLNQFVLDENSTWETRIEHLKRNKEILAALNNQANAEAEQTYTDALNGSGVWAITRDGNPLKIFSNKADAIKAKEDLVKKLVNEQIVPGMPSSVIETITQRIIEALEIKKYARGGVNVNTGLAWLDGTNANSEVVFNSAQAKQLYDIVQGGEFGKMVSNNILNSIKSNLANLTGDKRVDRGVGQINISFPNATINAKDYDSFKGFMDRYTNDLLLKMQVGL